MLTLLEHYFFYIEKLVSAVSSAPLDRFDFDRVAER